MVIVCGDGENVFVKFINFNFFANIYPHNILGYTVSSHISTKMYICRFMPEIQMNMLCYLYNMNLSVWMIWGYGYHIKACGFRSYDDILLFHFKSLLCGIKINNSNRKRIYRNIVPTKNHFFLYENLCDITVRIFV